MERIKDFVQWFVYITSGILIVCAVNFSLYGDGTIPCYTLWEILLSAFLTTFVTVLLMPDGKTGIKHMILGRMFHYICLSVVMIGCGTLFGWMNINIEGIVMMLVSVGCVYLFSFGIGYLLDKKIADDVNRALQERRKCRKKREEDADFPL